MVVAEGEGGLNMRVSEATRPFIVEAVDECSAVVKEALVDDSRPREDAERRARLAAIQRLQLCLRKTHGATELTGPERVILDVVKAAARTASYTLDTRVESLAGMQARLDQRASDEMRAEAGATLALIDAWIACERQCVVR